MELSPAIVNFAVPTLFALGLFGSLLYLIRRDLKKRDAADGALRKSAQRFLVQQSALIGLTRSNTVQASDPATILRQITETAASTLRVERVSIWRYSESRQKIFCVDLYELNANRHSAGMELHAANYPSYFQALSTSEIIAAADARHDPRTREFSKDYLQPLGITSMMDVPTFLFGKLDGVLCHEHVGPLRTWLDDERMFAIALSNLISLAYEQGERKRGEEALRRSEQQLRQAQKMEVVGKLAGGIAHDFNNLLTVITGYSEILLSNMSEADPIRRELNAIKQAGEKAGALTRQLLAFSRRQMLQPKVIDLNAVVNNLGQMLRRLVGEDIDLVAVLDKKLWRLKADPGQIEQVLMNLVVNARDAMPKGGKLTIETANVELDENYARQHVTVKSGQYVMLAVSDTGCGMDAETQSHLFEPFFTTKEHGKGTGLGLSTVYGIIKQSGGTVWVYSEPGQGATFKIYLPRLEEDGEMIESSAILTPKRRGSETVLLVEDEEIVRTLVRTILTDNSYIVLEAQNGREAIRICEEFTGQIHILMTDIVMPEMSGRELAERLAISRPHVKVLYTSGYTDDAVVRHGVLAADTAFLQKPFTPDVLLNKMREVLEAPQRL